MEPVQCGDADEGAPSLGGVVRSDGAELRFDGDTVTKLHRVGTDPQALRQRLRVAARCEQMLAPCSVDPEPAGGRWLTRWPRVDVVAQDPAALPWGAAGGLLAALHRAPVEEWALPHGAEGRLRRALRRLGTGPRADVIRRAAAGWRAPEGAPKTLVHGDFHLGQMGWYDGGWVLIDVDDLGVGAPGWDLGRPAGFWAAGLVPDADWDAFVDGYRSAGGPAVLGEPWPQLEPYARAAVLAAAANHPEDDMLVAACARMV